jgi:feruloyl esterase
MTPVLQTAPYVSLLLDQKIKYSVTRASNYNSLWLDPEDPGAWAGRVSEPAHS